MVEDPLVQPYIDKVCGPQEAVMGLSPALLSHMMHEMLVASNDGKGKVLDQLIDIQWGLTQGSESRRQQA